MRNQDLRNDLATVLAAMVPNKEAQRAWIRVVKEVAARHRAQRETQRKLKRALFGLADAAERIERLMGAADAP